MRFTEPALDLWSSIKLNCCWSQQLLPVTSYLNSEKWTASGLLEKGNHRAGKFPGRIPKQAVLLGPSAASSTPARGSLSEQPGLPGGSQCPTSLLTNPESAKPVSQGLLGFHRMSTGKERWLWWTTFFSRSPSDSSSSNSSFSTFEQYAAVIRTRQKRSNWILLPWANSRFFPEYFKNSNQKITVRTQGKDSSQGSVALGWLRLPQLIKETKIKAPPLNSPALLWEGHHEITHEIFKLSQTPGWSNCSDTWLPLSHSSTRWSGVEVAGWKSPTQHLGQTAYQALQSYQFFLERRDSTKQ